MLNGVDVRRNSTHLADKCLSTNTTTAVTILITRRVHQKIWCKSPSNRYLLNELKFGYTGLKCHLGIQKKMSSEKLCEKQAMANCVEIRLWLLRSTDQMRPEETHA